MKRQPPPELACASLQRLIAAPPAVALQASFWTLVVLVAALFAWSWVAQLDIVALAPGRLVPASQVKTVQAGEPGIVREILVSDGDPVSAGQALLRLDPTVAGADAGQLDHDLALKRITVAAIDAVLADRALPRRLRGVPAAWIDQVHAQFSARRLAFIDAVQLERQAGARARSEWVAARQVRDKLRATLPLLQQAAESFRRLEQEGFVGELMANEKQRDVIEREQDLKAQDATVGALEAAVAQSEQRIAQLHSGFRSQLLGERVEAQATIERLRQEQARQAFRRALLEIRAPQDGVVHNLAVHTPGAVVQAAAVLLQIVPQDDALLAEVAIGNEDVGFVAAGQQAWLKLATFPFQKYGLIEGRVLRISADAEAPDASGRIGQPPLAYKAVIELVAQQLLHEGAGLLDLVPGMALTAEIHCGRRTVMEYLLSPLQGVVATAGRER